MKLDMNRPILFALVAATAALTSCSHNGFLLAKGKVWSLNERGFTYINGVALIDYSRENTSIEAKVSDDDTIAAGENKDGTLNGGMEVHRNIGRQITGYLVDLAEVAPEAAKAYLDGGKEDGKAE